MIDRGTQIRGPRQTGFGGVEIRSESGPPTGKTGLRTRPETPRRNEGRIMTAPARIRLLRDAENPWYEMILIEGRNREIRKMFEEIGHHVEKIRRVGYGPLVLDLEPGRSRELTPDEVAALRRAAEGKRSAPADKNQAIRLPKAERRPRPRTTPNKSARPASHKPPITGKRTRRP
jgi:23S rRNA pseudouridine2605 synthase